VEKVIKKELNRRYGVTLFSQEEMATSSQKADSAPKGNKEKWKPSDDFAWF